MMRCRPSRAVRALACAGVACLLGGCGSTSSPTTQKEPSISKKVAVQLAGQTRVVESRLAAGDDCGAATAVDTLKRQAARAIAEREVPPALAQPLGQSIEALAVRISCTPEPASSSGDWNDKKHEKKSNDRHQQDEQSDEGDD
ncbi:MAG: hypothetical protein QOJ13_3219 [Gaiellales bacterium]|nr:hypothetical protein [Gaiellales bacterium]